MFNILNKKVTLLPQIGQRAEKPRIDQVLHQREFIIVFCEFTLQCCLQGGLTVQYSKKNRQGYALDSFPLLVI